MLGLAKPWRLTLTTWWSQGRDCTPPDAPGSQHHCLSYDRASGCPHHTALPVEHHIYTYTQSYSLLICKISSAHCLSNFFPCLLSFQVFKFLQIKKIFSVSSSFQLPQWVSTFPLCFLHRPYIRSSGTCMSWNIHRNTSLRMTPCLASGKLMSSCSSYWVARVKPPKMHLLSWTRWTCKFLITFSCNQNQFLSQPGLSLS